VQRRSFQLEIFLVSFALLLVQIGYTRVFSFKLSSYFTYLVIGFAMLGVGSGGVFVALSSRLRSVSLERLVSVTALIGSAALALGYGVVGALELQLHYHATDPGQIARLVLLCATLFAGFLSMGLIVAAILARRSESIHRLYFADLAGAGAGCALAIPLMWLVSPPGCVFASAAVVAVAGLRPARAGARVLVAPLLVSFVLLSGLAVIADRLPDPIVDPAKQMSREQLRTHGPSLFRAWSPVFRVDVLEVPSNPALKALVHDGMWGSALWRGDRHAPRLMEEETTRRLPFAVVKPRPRVLIIGAAGGHEIVASLHFGAERITAVELNPVTVSILRDHFADFTGHLPEQEQVTLVNAEGRSYLSSDSGKYEIIYFVAPDSYATMNSAQASGFVLAESYLYTVEAVQEVMRHLEPDGVLAMQFGEVNLRWPTRTPRYLATARRALEEMGIGDFRRHVLLSSTREFPFHTTTILLKPTPFSDEQVERFVSTANELPDSQVLHAPGQPGRGISSAIITVPSKRLDEVYQSYPHAIDPITDDLPFFWHFRPFRDVLTQRGESHFDAELGQGEATLVVMLGISTAFAAVFLLLPFLIAGSRWSSLPAKLPSALYFAALGLGFMCFEISMIQKLTLFLGYPTRTLSVTLFSLLLFSGLGSLATGAYLERRDRALPILIVAIVACTIFYRVGLDPLVHAAAGAPLALRIALVVAVLAPLGLCLGAFMPLGIATVSRATPASQRADYVAWAWGLNGFFSVIGSLLVTMLSMSYGFRAVLLLAALLYIAAALLLRTIPLEPAPPEVQA